MKNTTSTEKYLDQVESIRKVQSQESEALEQQLKELARDYNKGTIEAIRDLILAKINSTFSENPIRIALFGTTAVGKTSIINCLTGGNFPISQGPMDTTQDIMVHEFGAVGVRSDGRQVKQNFKLIDTPGFGSILQTTDKYFNRFLSYEVGERADVMRSRNFDVAICIVECLKWSEFEDLHKRIIETGVPVLLVSNKYDQIMGARMGEELARKNWESMLESKIPISVQKCYFMGLGNDDLDIKLPRKLDLDKAREVRDTLTTEFKQRLLVMLNHVRTYQYQNICQKFIKIFLDERMAFIKERWKDVGWMKMASSDYKELASQSSSQHFGLVSEQKLHIESKGINVASASALAILPLGGLVGAAIAYFGAASLKHLYNRYKDTGIEEIERNREEAKEILMNALACGVPAVLKEFDQSNQQLGLQSSPVKLKMQPAQQQPAPRPADGRTFP